MPWRIIYCTDRSSEATLGAATDGCRGHRGPTVALSLKYAYSPSGAALCDPRARTIAEVGWQLKTMRTQHACCGAVSLIYGNGLVAYSLCLYFGIGYLLFECLYPLIPFVRILHIAPGLSLPGRR
jgi:hypothetical protein